MTRIVVTGIGLLTPLGVGTDATWQGLVEGRSAIGPIQDYDPSSLRTRVAGEIPDLDPEEFVSRKALRSMTRNDQLAVAAAALAVRDAGLVTEDDGERAGLFVGSSKEISNPMHILEASLVARNEDGSVDIRRLGEQASSAFYPLFYVEGLQAASLFYISQAHGMKGANAYFAGTAESGATAVGRAYRAVKRGEAAWALAGGFDDASSWWNQTKFESLGLLSETACRPYDAERDGTVLGEGAAFLVLEPEDAAQARGADVYAEVAGFGSAYDGHRLITPDPDGQALERAIEAALREAEAGPGDIDFVAAHGSGTVLGDASEARALSRVFGSANGTHVSSVKAATGHLMGGAGALNAAVAALGIRHGAIPPTLNLESQDACCEVDVVRGEARRAEIGSVVALARGLEGQNVALVLRAIR